MKIVIYKAAGEWKISVQIKYDMFILDRNVLLSYTTITLYLTAFTRFVLLPSWEFTGYLTLPQAINYGTCLLKCDLIFLFKKK